MKTYLYAFLEVGLLAVIVLSISMLVTVPLVGLEAVKSHDASHLAAGFGLALIALLVIQAIKNGASKTRELRFKEDLISAITYRKVSPRLTHYTFSMAHSPTEYSKLVAKLKKLSEKHDGE